MDRTGRKRLKRSARRTFSVDMILNPMKSYAQVGDPETKEAPADHGRVEDKPHPVVEIVLVERRVAAVTRVKGRNHSREDENENDHHDESKNAVHGRHAGPLLLVVE